MYLRLRGLLLLTRTTFSIRQSPSLTTFLGSKPLKMIPKYHESAMSKTFLASSNLVLASIKYHMRNTYSRLVLSCGWSRID